MRKVRSVARVGSAMAIFARFSLVLVLASASLACGSSDGDESDGGTGVRVQCQAGEFRLEGTVDGAAVVRSEPTSGSGLSQLNGGEFSSNWNDADEGRTRLELTWERALAHGHEGAASGTLALPSGEARAGEALCVGGVVGFDDEGAFYFGLDTLAGGASCEQALDGRLDGCWGG